MGQESLHRQTPQDISESPMIHLLILWLHVALERVTGIFERGEAVGTMMSAEKAIESSACRVHHVKIL